MRGLPFHIILNLTSVLIHPFVNDPEHFPDDFFLFKTGFLKSVSDSPSGTHIHTTHPHTYTSYSEQFKMLLQHACSMLLWCQMVCEGEENLLL